MDLPDTLAISPGKVVIHSNHMDSFSGQGVQICGKNLKRGDEITIWTHGETVCVRKDFKDENQLAIKCNSSKGLSTWDTCFGVKVDAEEGL